MAETLDTLRAIIGEQTGLADVPAAPQTAVSDLAGWDSVTMTCVILAVETQFEFTFTPAEMDRLATLQDFLDVIEAKAAA